MNLKHDGGSPLALVSGLRHDRSHCRMSLVGEVRLDAPERD